MDVKTIRELTRLMRDYDLQELEVEADDLKVRLSKASTAAPVVSAPAATPVAPATPAVATPSATPAPVDEFAACHKVVSPIPGTVYLKPNPETPNFVEVGTPVKDDQVVCLVEAMKVFNEIKCENVAGIVKKVCVEDGQAVEYGTVLFLVG